MAVVKVAQDGVESRLIGGCRQQIFYGPRASPVPELLHISHNLSGLLPPVEDWLLGLCIE